MPAPDEESWVNQTLAEAVLASSGDDVGHADADPVSARSTIADRTPVEPVVSTSSDAPSTAAVASEEDRVDAATDETAPNAGAASGGEASGVAVAVDDEDDDEEQGFLKGLLEWVVVLVGAVAVALLLRAFLFQAFFIPSESMEETLQLQDRVLVNKLSYQLHDVNRGDVVVFRRPENDPGEIRELIKRVIALPGETVEGRDNTVYIDGRALSEPYLAADEFIADFGPFTVPDGEFFVMGDNRDESFDSRRFGTIGEERIVGRAFVLFWPLDRLGAL